MGKRYLIVSDLHLSDIEDHDDGWKVYQSSRFSFDDDFALLLKEFVSQPHGPGVQTLVLNGDIFDFDLVTAVPDDPPWPVTPFERERGLDPTEAKSVWKITRILAQHPRFIAALCDFITGGHQLVYVLGNHDREFHFPAVQQALVAALAEHAARQSQAFPRGAVRFEPWFYYVPGEIYAEHGNQFDHYSSFRDVLSPTIDTKDGLMLAIPMANLSNRYMGTRMGFFNPHAADFILNMYRYLAHWLEYYAFSQRRLVTAWFVGSLIVISRLLHIKKRQLLRRRDDAQVAEVSQRYGLPLETVLGLLKLHRPPITNRLYRVLREFWIDRLVMALVMALGLVGIMLLPLAAWAKVTVPLLGFPLVYFVYEWLAQGDSAFTFEQEFPKFARAVAESLPVKVVTFGHAHKPRMIPLGHDVTFVDTGTWAPVTERGRWGVLAPGYRNYLVVSVGEGETGLKFDCWQMTPRAANEDVVRDEKVEPSGAAADLQRAG